ncbi:helix-turn-helix domain-containing protein [Rhizobium johnstonii]|uniref:helix-turn-helix domain-containing protein n=1 Tax=Rhizobium TaxID=379 RepID=UPI00140F8B9B|nr:helix-turn-helix domain-containing protein [Rhizobium leguminosarum]QIO64031.1 helix-turn-helix domain-containing protein [Rhizobium leguminosarum bv. trifolii]
MVEAAQPGQRQAAQPDGDADVGSLRRNDAHNHRPLGATIRNLRKNKGLSLTQVSERSGVSVGMVSQVERDKSNPSVRVLSSILHALDAPISALFKPHKGKTEDPDFVCRAKGRPILQLGHLNKELLSSKSPNNLQLMILHIDEGGSSGEHPLVYPADKGGLVLKGKIKLKVGDREARLLAGDSFAFGPLVPHSFRHAGKGPAEVLWVIGPASFEGQL